MDSQSLSDSKKTHCSNENLTTDVSCKEESVESNAFSLTQNSQNLNKAIVDEKPQANGEGELCKFFMEGKCRFADKCFNLHPIDCPQEKNGKHAKGKLDERHSKPGKSNHRTPTKSKLVAEVPDSPKKPSMKTAENVISRILWDDDLPMEHFVIGYLDRFAGIVEKPFSAFSWENIASVDYNVLAIPRHRIQYFRYKKHKVWDKNERLDIVFGSTGYEMNIYDFMKKIDAAYSGSDDRSETHHIEDFQLESLHFKNPNQHRESKPNYFLCIRITNPEIKETVGLLLDQMEQLDSTFSDCFISEKQLHVTIFMLRLENEFELTKTVEILQNHRNEFSSCLWPQVELLIDGLDNFKDQVLYAKVSYEPNFLLFVKTIEQALREGDINIIKDFADYTPHMTLIRIPREKNCKLISPFLYQSFAQMYFGNQNVNNLHLCLLKEKQEDGFYKSLCEIQF